MTRTDAPIQIPVEGMTCGHCVATVRKALEAVPGVASAEVDLAARLASVSGDPEVVSRRELEAAIVAAGYSVPTNGPPVPQLVSIGPAPRRVSEPAPPEEWNLAIGGMHCASCVGRVESALLGVPGVSEARVNLATERAGVRVDPGVVTEAKLAEAVVRAGYQARRAELRLGEGAEALRRERSDQVATWRRRLVVGVVGTVR